MPVDEGQIIKELNGDISQLEDEVSDLEVKNQELEDELSDLKDKYDTVASHVLSAYNAI